MTVIVHNPSSTLMNQFIRLRLPSNLYKIQRWTPETNRFTDTKSDIFEQKHISGDRKESTDYLMFVPAEIKANDIGVYKVVRVEKPVQDASSRQPQNSSLAIKGFSSDNDVIFEYKNGEFVQKFGFNLRYYLANQVVDYRARHGPKGLAEGAYLFKVDLDHLSSIQYSSLDLDVPYEHGVFLD
jgi:hypothetical protein